VEYLLTSYVVDVGPLTRRSDWIATFGRAGSAGPILLAIVTAVVLLDGRRLLEELRAALHRSAERQNESRPHARWVSLGVHLAAFASFLSITVFFSTAGEDLPRFARFLAVAWIVSILSALLALTNVVAPLRAFVPLARRAGLPLALGPLLGIAAWAGGVASVRFWDPLGALTLESVAALLRLAGPDVAADATMATLSFEGFGVVISPACSGYEGIGLFLVLMSAYLWICRARLRFPHAFVVLLVGIALVWLANVVRISALMLVGARWSSEVALGSFHSKAGWVLFCGITLALVASTGRTKFLSRTEGAASEAWNPTAAYLTPLLALVAVHMVTGVFSDGLPVLYPLGILAAALMLWRHRGVYPWLFRPSWSWQACAIGVAVFALWIALEPDHDPAFAEAWRRDLASLPVPLAVGWLTVRVIGSVVVVPLVEELAFRGYLLRRVFAADFTSVSFARFGWLSLVISSIAYGLLHERWLAGILAGALFAAAQYRRGRLTDALLAHAVTNALVAIHATGWQRWSLWS
jgi:exosortase E/protease (VPEID-CTERM system)